MMQGVQFEEVWKALSTGYTKNSLKQMLRFRLDRDLDVIVADGSLKDITFELIGAAEREGWDIDLIREAYRFNDRNPDLMRVYQKYGLGVEIELQKSAPVELQKTGAKLLAAVASTDDKFEVAAKKNLAFIDIAVFRERLLEVEGRVCRIELNNGTAAMGTGFLVGPDAVLTNYHVMKPIIDNPALAGAVKLRFDYKIYSNGTKSDGVLASLHPTKWLTDFSEYSPAERQGRTPDQPPPTADQLDYALLKLSAALGDEPINPKAPQSPKRGWVRVPDNAPAITPHMPLYILQHPNRAPLKLAMDTDAVTGLNANQTRVKYATNTEPGSSGSPCFDQDWKLVALHHYGDESFGHPPFNQGIPVTLIRQRLTDKGEAAALGGDVA